MVGNFPSTPPALRIGGSSLEELPIKDGVGPIFGGVEWCWLSCLGIFFIKWSQIWWSRVLPNTSLIVNFGSDATVLISRGAN